MSGGSLPVTAVAEIVQVDRQQYYEWRDQGLLGSRRARAKLTLTDALEMAALNVLTRATTATKAALAYPAARDAVREWRPGQRIELAWVDADREAALIRAGEELLKLARRSRPVLLLGLHAELERVQVAFAREASVSRRTRRRP